MGGYVDACLRTEKGDGCCVLVRSPKEEGEGTRANVTFLV